jgi:hypothetical protein
MMLYELRNLLTAYVGRSDPEFLAYRDDFIRLGHRYVERQWVGREQHFRLWQHHITLPTGAASVPLPGDYRHSQSLTMHATTQGDPEHLGIDLERVPAVAMVRDAPWRLSDGTTINLYDRVTQGEPRAYGVLGRTAHFRPILATTKVFWLSGIGWAWIDQDTEETVLTQADGTMVLYAAIREAWGFLGDPVQKAYWEAEANKAIEAWARDAGQEEVAGHGLPLVMDYPG